MSPVYAPLFCGVTGRAVFTLIISGIRFLLLHLVAGIGSGSEDPIFAAAEEGLSASSLR